MGVFNGLDVNALEFTLRSGFRTCEAFHRGQTGHRCMCVTSHGAQIRRRSSPVLQVLFPTKDIGDLQAWYDKEEETFSSEAKSIICKTLARKRMQV